MQTSSHTCLYLSRSVFTTTHSTAIISHGRCQCLLRYRFEFPRIFRNVFKEYSSRCGVICQQHFKIATSCYKLTVCLFQVRFQKPNSSLLRHRKTLMWRKQASNTKLGDVTSKMLVTANRSARQTMTSRLECNEDRQLRYLWRTGGKNWKTCFQKWLLWHKQSSRNTMMTNDDYN